MSPIPGSHRFLHWVFSHSHNRDETGTIAGDIIDYHQHLRHTRGRLHAWLWTGWQVIGSCCHLIRGYGIWRLSMFKNYLKIAWRNLKRNKIYTVINLIGLSVAVAWCILVFCFVRDELTHDLFHEHIDRLALVGVTDNQTGVSFTPHAPLGPSLVANTPEIEEYARLINEEGLIKMGNTLIKGLFIGTDPDFFTMFTFPLKWGSAETFIRSRNAVYLSQSMSKKIFGEDDPVGRIVSVKFQEEFQPFEIAGVFRSLPTVSCLSFDAILHADHFLRGAGDDWTESAEVFLKIAPVIEMEAMTARFDAITRPFLDVLPRGQHLAYRLIPFRGYYLNAFSVYYSSLKPSTTMGPSWILISIAALILLLASTNYVNLAMGCMTRRVKEIGIRKIMGAARKQVIRQLLGESYILILTAMGAGVLLAGLILPTFQTWTGKTISFISILKPEFWMLLGVLALVLGLLIAVYPAALLSRIQSSEILQGRYRPTGRGHFSKGIIIIQFAISVFLISVTLIVARQHQHMLFRHFGSNLDQVMRIDLGDSVNPRQLTKERVRDFKMKIAALPGVRQAAGALARLTGHANIVNDREGRMHILFTNQVEPAYFSILGLRLKQGSLMAEDTNGRALIVSEGMARIFIQGDPIGQTLGKLLGTRFGDIPITGVVEDFNVLSLKGEVNPQVIEIDPEARFRFIYVRLQAGTMQETLSDIRRWYLNLWPDTLLEYGFVSDHVADMYSQLARWSSIVKISSAVALFIACSGLFGLTLLVVMRRSKEMSIRKILGATPGQIMGLVQKDFMILVLAGNVLAWPGAFFTMRRWLNDFAHRTTLSWWIFAAATLIAVTIAVLTIGVQSLSTSRVNPADNLRDQ